jgi:hypothetical protein
MADRYWRGGTGTWNTTSTTNWSDTSGGAGGFSVPTASDNVIFDQAATYSVTMTGILACLSITVSAGTVSFLTGTTPTLQVNGSMSLIAGTVWTSTGAITFNSTTTGQTITTGGTTINAPITFNGAGGEWSLGSALTTGATQTTTLTNGALILNGFDLTTGIFSSSNANTRSIAFGATNINLTHTTAGQTVLNMAVATGFTWTTTTSGALGTSTGCFQSVMDRTRTFVFGTTGGSITNAPTLYLSSGASIATITTGSYFNELNLGTCSFTIAATSLNLNQLYTASSSCVLTNMTVTMRGTGYIQTATSIGPLIINTSGTVYMPTGGSVVNCTTFTLTAGSFSMYTNGTLTCSSTFTFSGGSIDYLGAINCTTFTVAGANFAMVAGSLTPSVSFVITSGTFTYSGGTLAAVPTFTHTAGTVNFNKDYALTTNGTYTFTAGALNLITNITLSTGIFSSANTNTRSIAFGSTSNAGNIQLTHTTAATTVLSMATLTGFSFTGVGGFTVTDMANTRTFSVGNTAGGSATNAPSLTFTTGASVATLTTGSWFKDLSFFDTTFNPGTTALNIAGNLLLGNGLYTTLSITMRGSGWLQNRYNTITQAMAALTINTTGTINLYPGGYNWWCTTLTITAGTLDFTGSGDTITCSSTVTYTAGTLTLNDGAMYCTTFTVNGAAFTFNAGGLYPSVSFVLTSGSLTLGGTAILNDGVLPLFTHTAGTVTLNKSWAIGSAGTSGTYTFTAGTLTISEGYYLQCAIFSSSGAGVRTINFGTTRYTPSYYNWPSVGSNTATPSYIYLYNSTAAQTVLNMAIATNFTWTGSGLFNFPGANTATMVFGTTGGSTTNAPNLLAGGLGGVLTVTTGSWFNVFNLLNAAYTTPATSVNVVEAFLLYNNGTHTGVTIVPKLTTTSIINNGYTFGGLTVNVADANIQLTSELVLAGALTLTQGTINTNTSNVTSASFASTGPYSRSIIGTNTTYTISGAGTTAWNFGSTGSALLNGTTQYLIAPIGSSTFGSGDFTAECWFYKTSATTCTLLSNATGNADNNYWSLSTYADGHCQFTIRDATSQLYVIGTIISAINTWIHVAIVRQSGVCSLYVNGVFDASTTITKTITARTTLIGSFQYTGFVDFFPGYITNARTVTGVAVYTGNFTVPTEPLLPTQSADTNISAITGSQTSLLLSTPINSFLTDYSNNNFTVTNTGTATANILSPFAVMSPGITFTGFTISMTSASAKTFVGSGGTYPIINQGGAGALTITGNNTFYNITNTTQPTTISFTAATTTTFKYFSLDGIAGNLVTVTSATAANHTLSMSSGIANTQYMSISRSQATGGAGWIAATSTNGGTNSGWVFAAPRFVEMGDISFDTTDGGITFT